MSEQDYIHKLRHTAEHVLTLAMQNMFGPEKIIPAMGPATDEGFYFDFDHPEDLTISEKDFKKIEKQMQKIIKKDLPMNQKDLTVSQAKKVFKDNPYKLEWIQEHGKETGKISTYDLGGKFIDVCAGPHVDSTGEIKAFKLTKIAGAYRRGDEKNKMLTRIYGVAFTSQEELDNYIHIQEEAKKRDHRVLGKKLGIYSMTQDVGLGLILWKPNGAKIVNTIKNRFENEQIKRGYVPVITPHIGRKSLWEQSGHWGFYNESMYPPIELGQTLEEWQDNRKPKETEVYLLKPMNCPLHVNIYNDDIHSYRDLPIKYYEFGTVYRYEKKGELGGLTRVRGFTQDDAHIIVSKDKLEEEFAKVVDFVMYVLNKFEFKDIEIYVSVRDQNKKDYYLGDDSMRDTAEKTIEKVLKTKNIKYDYDEGGAVFYGPKADFKVKDSIGRERQLSTVQFDFNLPERFDMSYVNKKGEKEKPFMIHRALLGSLERFMGVLIEHFAGAFPFWLAPEQVRIIPVADKFLDYAESIKSSLLENGVRVNLDNSTDSFSKKIRNGELMKIPYLIIVGEKEMNNKTINVRDRDTKFQKEIKIQDFVNKID